MAVMMYLSRTVTVLVVLLLTIMKALVSVLQFPAPNVPDQNNTGLIGTGDRAETYTGGLKYDANNIYRLLSTPRPTTQLA